MPHTLSCERLGEADTENGSAVFGGIEVDRLSTAVVLLSANKAESSLVLDEAEISADLNSYGTPCSALHGPQMPGLLDYSIRPASFDKCAKFLPRASDGSPQTYPPVSSPCMV